MRNYFVSYLYVSYIHFVKRVTLKYKLTYFRSLLYQLFIFQIFFKMRSSVILFLIIATLALAQQRVTLNCPDEGECCACKSVYYFYSTCICYKTTPGDNSSFVYSVFWNKYLTIRCDNSPSWKDMYYHNGSYSLSNIEDLTFDQCKFPEHFYFGLSNGLSTNRIKTFNFKNGKTENGIVNRTAFRGFYDLRQISLPNNGLKNLTSDVFRDMNSLQYISLKDNEITILPFDIFWTLQYNLRTIDLSNNDITIIPERLFQKNDRLEKLDLSGNSLTAITSGMFIGLINLKMLNVENNDLQYIEYKALEELKNMEIARFSHNNLNFNVNFQNSPFQKCSNLKELLLGHNNISRIFADWIFNTPYLRVLDLQHNSIESIKVFQVLMLIFLL